jgi:hypothetical protein
MTQLGIRGDRIQLPTDPDPSSVKEERSSVADAQKHMDPSDPNPDADPEHWYINIILQR